MYKYLIMLTFCVITQRIYSKSLLEYSINPEYDLVSQESTSYSNFRPSSEFLNSRQKRYNHYGQGRGHGYGYGNRKHASHDFDLYNGYNYPDSPEEYGYDTYHLSHSYHPHGIPPGQAKNQGHHNSHPYENPPRFPPPPVYHNDFINPWTLRETTPKHFVQQPPLTTPRSFYAQKPARTTPAVFVVPTRKTTTLTTPAAPSRTAADDDLIYDIDVRFGRD